MTERTIQPITVHVHVAARPDAAEQLSAMLRGALPSIRAKPGCHGARLLSDAEDPGRLLLVEQWSSVQRHETHVAQLVSEGVMERVLGLTTEPPRTEYLGSRT